MQRFINDPDFVVDDTVRGFIKAHGELVKLTDNPKVVAFAQAPIRGKVGVITGGGSGHEPAFIGYVGRNMLGSTGRRPRAPSSGCGPCAHRPCARQSRQHEGRIHASRCASSKGVTR